MTSAFFDVFAGELAAVAKRAGYAALAAAVFAGAVRAEDTKPVRVGASHRVDVIAPGERVETAIDRMRRISPPAREVPARAVDPLAPRPPIQRAPSEHGSEHGSDRGGADRAPAERGADRPGEPKQGAPTTAGPQGPQRR